MDMYNKEKKKNECVYTPVLHTGERFLASLRKKRGENLPLTPNKAKAPGRSRARE